MRSSFIIFFIAFPFVSLTNCFSQEAVVRDFLEELAAADIPNETYDEIEDDLQNYLEKPLNLNRADEDDLKHLHILNDFQIYTLLDYLHKYGSIYSVNELQTIPGFSQDIITKMGPYITLSPGYDNEKTNPGRLRQKLIFRYGQDLNRKNGFIPDTLSSEIPFPGKNRSVQSRYQIKSGGRFIAGITTDQDPGETFKPQSQSFCPDFVSAFFEMHLKGFIRQVNIGDFRAGYGQGLVLSSSSQRKGSAIILKPPVTGIRKYSAAAENDMLRGVAVRMGKGQFSLDVFYSRLRRDAIIYSDTLPYFKSLSSTGYHRTGPEADKKDALLQTGGGAALSFKTNLFSLGITASGQKFSEDFVFTPDPFNSTRVPKNELIINAGSDIKLSMKNVVLFGEIAIDNAKRIALISGLIAELHPLVQYSFVFRDFHPSYLALRSDAFGEKTATRNESGFYTGIEMYPLKKIRLDIFSDHYSSVFPGASFSGPESGNEYFINCTFTPSRDMDLSFRLRYEKDQDKSDGTETGIDIMEIREKLSTRFELKCNVSPEMKLKSRTEISYFSKENTSWLKGYYCGNDISYEILHPALKIWFRYAVFDIPGWENRIYAYENDVLYNFSVPAYNSRGTRTIVLFRFIPSPKFDISLRFASTAYPGKRTSGSGVDEIRSDRFRDYCVQMCLKL